jgi:hypothetical protein
MEVGCVSWDAPANKASCGGCRCGEPAARRADGSSDPSSALLARLLPPAGGDPQLWHDALEYFSSQSVDCSAHVGGVAGCGAGGACRRTQGI